VEREPVIKGLTIQGFRSIANERIEFDNLTFLVGRNGAGKSNIVDAFAMLGGAMSHSLPNLLSQRGGIQTVFHKEPGKTFPLDFGLRAELESVSEEIRGTYAFLARATSPRHFIVQRESFQAEKFGFNRLEGRSLPGPLLDHIPQPHTAPDTLLFPLLSGVEKYAPAVRTLSAIRAYNIDPGRLREPAAPDNGWTLLPDGSNAASVLQEIRASSPEDFQTVSEFLSAALPYPVEVRPVFQSPSRLGLEMIQASERGEITLEALSASEGMLRLLGLLLAIFQPMTPSLLLIEEPEATIHPDGFGVVLDLLELAARRTQVVVTTHSPELLDAKWIEDRHLRVVTWQDGSTRVQRLSEGSKRVLQQHLAGAGEMLRTGSLDVESREPEAASLFAQAG
jgi:predicted ATPase